MVYEKEVHIQDTDHTWSLTLHRVENIDRLTICNYTFDEQLTVGNDIEIEVNIRYILLWQKDKKFDVFNLDTLPQNITTCARRMLKMQRILISEYEHDKYNILKSK